MRFEDYGLWVSRQKVLTQNLRDDQPDQHFTRSTDGDWGSRDFDQAGAPRCGSSSDAVFQHDPMLR